MSTKRLVTTALAFIALAACTFPAFAQEVYATLIGTIRDPSGAVVPGASVVVHSNETNTDVRTLTSDASGNFSVTNLPAGNYTVTVKSAGFRTYTAGNVVLNVAQKRPIDVQLQPGQVTENVTVTESTTPVQTTTAAQMGTVTGTQVRELELNNRNFEQLVTLQPGVATQLPDVVGFGLNNSTTISVNGARVTSNNWTVDGADINDSGSNGTLLNVPSVDAIQEFTLGRSNYDAQFGRSGGGQVLVGTKAGTSQFHGDAYEFVRNDAFNANNYFSNLVGAKKPPLRYNDYGFTVGGPLFIPKLYSKKESKTFFFWSEEWRKTGNPSNNTALVPTPAQLAGTFTGQLNTASAPAGCITNNVAANTSQINPACISKNAQAYIKNVYSLFPGNSAGGSQYINNYVAKQNYRQDLVRLDQNVTDKIHLFGRYMQDVVPTTEPGGLFASSPLPVISSTATNAPGKNVVANMSWAISPSVVNEAAFNYSWGAINSNLTGSINSPAFLGSLVGTLPYSDPYGRIPGVTISGYTGVSVPSAPYFERNIDKNFYDNFSKVVGNHTFRAGVTVQWLTKTENGPNPTNGTFTFSSAFGNPAFANFLLGDATLFTQSSRDIIPHLNYTNIEAYVQDDWKVTPRFTLNLGIRYSYFPAPSDSNNVLNNFDPLVYSPATAARIDPSTGNFVAGQAVIPANYVNGMIFPSGAGCTNAQKVAAVTCSPYGSAVNPNFTNNFGPRFGFAWDVLGNGKTAVRGGYGIFYDRTLNGIWEQNAFGDPPLVQQVQITNPSFDNVSAGNVGTKLGPVNLTATGTPTFKVPSYQDFNFSVEQQLTSNTVMQVAYVGTLGRHLLGDVDINQPTLAARAANPTANVNAIRPYLGYAAITTRAPIFISNYNSLQVSLNRRVSSGLTLGVAYTWSKNLSNNPVDRGTANADTYNLGLDYGPAPLNTPQVFVANYVYTLPFFKDQKGFVGHVLGGWEWSGVTTFDSGQSQTIRQANDPFDNRYWPAGSPGIYPGGIGITNDTVPPRANLTGASITGPGTVGEWFNTAAFTDAIGHFGTAGRGILLSPGIENWDMAGIRNFKFGERASLQFRGEFFNTFNHVNFTGLGVNVDTPSTFGKLTTEHNPRTIQLGLKLYF